MFVAIVNTLAMLQTISYWGGGRFNSRGVFVVPFILSMRKERMKVAFPAVRPPTTIISICIDSSSVIGPASRFV